MTTMRALRPVRSTTRAGLTVRRSDCDSLPGTVATETTSRRLETLRMTNVRVARQAAPVPGAERERRRRGGELAGRARAHVDAADARGGERCARGRTGVADKEASQVGGAETRPSLREQRRGAGDRGGGRARAVDGREGRLAVGGGARVGGGEAGPGRGQVGLDEAAERESARRERRDAARTAVRLDARPAERDRDVESLTAGPEQRARRPGRQGDDRDADLAREPERAGRQALSVDEAPPGRRRARLRRRPLPGRLRPDERSAAGDEAEAARSK